MGCLDFKTLFGNRPRTQVYMEVSKMVEAKQIRWATQLAQ